MYYKRHEFLKRFTFFFSSGIIAGAFGGLLAFALVKMDGLGGYSGWRWYTQNLILPSISSTSLINSIYRIFIIEGLATIAFSFIAKFAIVDWPETSKFLNEEEKKLVSVRLANDGAGGVARMDRLDRPALFRILKDWKIWVW